MTSGANNGDTINGLAIATEQGDFITISKNTNNGCASVGFGQGSVSGTSASGTADWAIVQYSTIPGVVTDCTEPDGTRSGTTLTGTCQARYAHAQRHGHNVRGHGLPRNNLDMDL